MHVLEINCPISVPKGPWIGSKICSAHIYPLNPPASCPLDGTGDYRVSLAVIALGTVGSSPAGETDGVTNINAPFSRFGVEVVEGTFETTV